MQDNHSHSSKNVLRCLHHQIVRPQGKLFRVVQGEVFDLAVDIRKSSPTLGQWIGEKLSAKDKKQLWIPDWFAHGFLVLSESADFLYKITEYYAPGYERCIRWGDPEIRIEWPWPWQEGSTCFATKGTDAAFLWTAQIFKDFKRKIEK